MTMAERGRDSSSAAASGMVRSASTPAPGPHERVGSSTSNSSGPKPSGLRVDVTHLTHDHDAGASPTSTEPAIPATTMPTPNASAATPAAAAAAVPTTAATAASAAPIPIRPPVAPPPPVHTDPLSPGALADMYPGPRFSIASSPPPFGALPAMPAMPLGQPGSQGGRHPRRASRRSRTSITNLNTPAMPPLSMAYGFNMYTPYPVSPPAQTHAPPLYKEDSTGPRSPRGSDVTEMYWPQPLALLSPLIGSPTSDDTATYPSQPAAPWWGWQWPAVPTYPDPQAWSPGPGMNHPGAQLGGPAQQPGGHPPLSPGGAGARPNGRHSRHPSIGQPMPHPPPAPWLQSGRSDAQTQRSFEGGFTGGQSAQNNNRRQHRHTRSAGLGAWPSMTAPMVPFGQMPRGAATGFPPQRLHDVPPTHILPPSHPARATGARHPEQFKGGVVRMAQDQLGSRRLQDALARSADGTPHAQDDGNDATSIILSEVLPQAKTLMHDVFGNYVIQKLIEHGSPTQRHQLLVALGLIPSEDTGNTPPKDAEDDPSDGDLSSIARHTYACRVLQRALNYLTRRQAALLAVRLLLAVPLGTETTEDHVQTLATDQNANHVLQKFVGVLAPHQESVTEYGEPSAEADAALTTLVQAFLTRVHVLATHAYACRVLQRLLERLPAHTTRPLVQEVRADALKLMQDAYGNYVVQWLLQRSSPLPSSGTSTPSSQYANQARADAAASDQEEQAAIIEDHEAVLRLVLDPASGPDATGQVGGPKRFVHLARHKFASNVLEYVASTAKTHVPAHAVPRTSGPDAQPGAFFRLILDILLAPVPTDHSPVPPAPVDDTQPPTVVVLLHDQYANYVLQRVLNLVEPNDKSILASVLRPALRAPLSTSPQSRAARLPVGHSPLLTQATTTANQSSLAAAAATAAVGSGPNSPAALSPALAGMTLSPALAPASSAAASPALASASPRLGNNLPHSVSQHNRAHPWAALGPDHHLPKHIATIERLLEV